jgi:uncharacterized protein (TIGR03435 family)
VYWTGRTIRTTLTALLVVLVASENAAQIRGADPAFDVVSVRQVRDDLPPFFVRIKGRLLEARSSLREVIRFAYGLGTFDRIEADNERASRLLEARFEIQAKPPDDSMVPILDDFKAMTRKMLAERFKLRLELTRKMESVSVLRRVKPSVLGPNLLPFTSSCTPRPTGLRLNDPKFLTASRTSCSLVVYEGHVRGTTESMLEFVRFLSLLTRTQIIDGTELIGRYQVEMDFDPRSLSIFPTESLGDLPVFADALGRQLGLKIEKETRSVPIATVQNAELPSEN